MISDCIGSKLLLPESLNSLVNILQDIVEEGLISDAQLEAVVYANMRFQNTLSGRKELLYSYTAFFLS